MTELSADTFMPGRVLVSVAHADDIEFGIAGTIAKWVAAGAEVTYLVITDSRSGSNDPDADLDALVETRQQEQITAAAAVGVHDVRFLGYRDGILQPTLDLRRDITRIIRDVRPDVVITMDPDTRIAQGRGYINHPDHRAAAEATLYAVFPSAETRPIFPELLAEGLEPCKVKRLYLVLSNQSDTYVDISTVMEQKKAALRVHASQLNEEVVEMVTKWNAETGEKYGADYAEVFRVVKLNEDDLEQNINEEAATVDVEA